MKAKYNFRKTILSRLEICWNVLTHKTFIAYTTDDIGDKWQLINNGNLEQFGQWLINDGYKKNSNIKSKRMNKLEYIPGDLVMTNGVPIGTAKDVVYRVTSSDPTKTLERKDGTVLRGAVRLENIEGTKFGDKSFLFGDCGAWAKDIVPIRLTPAILRKNGWFNLDDCSHVFIFGEMKIATQLGVSSLFFNGTRIFSFEYVHELQHFLFTLGITREMEV